jgi:AcrR family transcriptional regulator
MATRETFQRARSETEKRERSREILVKAAELAREVGYEAFSMASLAKAAGLAKGTLYLYFETKEELFLALYLETLETWRAELEANTKPGMSDEAFCRLFMNASQTDPIFLDLSARLTRIIEYNVAVESLSRSKRKLRTLIEEVGALLEQRLGLAAGQGGALLWSLMALLIGAYATSAPAKLNYDALPDDVAAFMRQGTVENRFLPGACLIAAGLRAS